MPKISPEITAWSTHYLNDRWCNHGLPSGLAQKYLHFASECGSPIEQKMLAGLMFCSFGYLDVPAHLFWADQIPVPVILKSSRPIISPQAVISKLKWRVDFLITLPTYDNETCEAPTFVVECDGHDSHERTKEQAARDRRRDRDLQAMGIPILRFTGSEIYRDLEHCIDQIDSFGSRMLEDLWKREGMG